MTLQKRPGGSMAGFVAAGFLVATWAPALAQEAADQETPPAAVEEDDSWKDRSVRQLRGEYRDAEEAFYDAFNAVNSDDEFDMDCKTAPVLGSRKRERKCQAEFLWEYEAELGEEMYRRSSTGIAGSATTSTATLQRKQEALRVEMTNAVSEHPEVAAAFAELRRTKRNYELKMAED